MSPIVNTIPNNKINRKKYNTIYHLMTGIASICTAIAIKYEIIFSSIS